MPVPVTVIFCPTLYGALVWLVNVSVATLAVTLPAVMVNAFESQIPGSDGYDNTIVDALALVALVVCHMPLYNPLLLFDTL